MVVSKTKQRFLTPNGLLFVNPKLKGKLKFTALKAQYLIGVLMSITDFMKVTIKLGVHSSFSQDGSLQRCCEALDTIGKDVAKFSHGNLSDDEFNKEMLRLFSPLDLIVERLKLYHELLSKTYTLNEIHNYRNKILDHFETFFIKSKEEIISLPESYKSKFLNELYSTILSFEVTINTFLNLNKESVKSLYNRPSFIVDEKFNTQYSSEAKKSSESFTVIKAKFCNEYALNIDEAGNLKGAINIDKLSKRLEQYLGVRRPKSNFFKCDFSAMGHLEFQGKKITIKEIRDLVKDEYENLILDDSSNILQMSRKALLYAYMNPGMSLLEAHNNFKKDIYTRYSCDYQVFQNYKTQYLKEWIYKSLAQRIVKLWA